MSKEAAGKLSKQAGQAAEALFNARAERREISPVSETFGVTDPDVAYRVQEANTVRWLDAGRKLVGRKIGLTSKAVQQQLGVDEPDYGMLWGDSAHESGAEVPISDFIQPRVEAEIAFEMSADINSPNATRDDVERAIGSAMAAVEIVDSAVADWKITLADTIADNASGGGFVLGTERRTLGEIDTRLCGMVLTINDETKSLGVGAACLGDPINAVLWLARKMAEVGRPLAKGDIVLSGALGPMIDVVAGDRVSIEIAGFAPLHLSFGREGEVS
jgi:2-keto-4-pentenoate hydratase